MVTTKAISQALHLHFGLTYEQAADVIGSDRRKVANHISAKKAWASRTATERSEAIAAAQALIDAGGR